MKYVLGIALVIVIIWLIARRHGQTGSSFEQRIDAGKMSWSGAPTRAGASRMRAEIDSSVARDYGAGAHVGDLLRVERTPTAEHVPPSPAGLAVEAWSPRTQQLEVAGEWYRAANLRTLFTRHATLSESGDEIRRAAVLVPDPSNPYDKNAVAVFVDDLHVGYMERADARKYHQAISELPEGELVTHSRQWLRATDDDTWARVTLSPPDPDELQCPNPTSDAHVVLPPGATVQVTREEEHMDHLGALLKRYGTEKVVAARLRRVTEKRPRSTVELVVVEIDGQPVGVLSPTQTANFLPLVRRAESADVGLVCRASLRGNALKADVALHARKAPDLEDHELATLFETN
jgi:collagen type III alpha